MIYVLTLTKVCPGEPTGYISDLWEDCWTDRTAAERAFKKTGTHERILPKRTLGQGAWRKTEAFDGGEI